jgi:hypothetical protein
VLHLGLLQSLDLHNLLSQFDPQPMIQLHHFFVFDLSKLQLRLQLIYQILIHILFDYFLDEQINLIVPFYLLECEDDFFHRVQLTSGFGLQFELLNYRHNILHQPCISLPLLFILSQICLNNQLVLFEHVSELFILSLKAVELCNDFICGKLFLVRRAVD